MPKAIWLTAVLLHAGVVVGATLTVSSIPLAQKPVLQPDPAYGRSGPVLWGVLLVRFRPEHTPWQLLGMETLPVQVLRVEPLLPPQLWQFLQTRSTPQNAARRAAIAAAAEPLLRTVVLEYADPLPPEQVAQRLRKGCPAVEVAEPYPIALPCQEPNDPLLPRQQLLRTIAALQAWELSQGDSTVVIGIVDTGVFPTHEDLQGSLHYNRGEIPFNGIDDDGNGYVDDFFGYNFTAAEDGTSPGDPYNPGEGHGTAVAGIAAATTNNGIGIAGIGYRCRFFPVKASPVGVPAIYYGYQGILYCAAMGFAVINCSWGSPTYSCIQQSVIDFALASGSLVVAAAGNTPVATSAWYPAGYAGVLGVGNTTPEDRLLPYSARGLGVGILAPGEGAWTTDNGGGYTTFGGTSAAAPVVAGAAALLRAYRRELGPLQVLALLRRTAEDIGAENPEDADALPGRLNLWMALASDPLEMPGLVLPQLVVTNAAGTPLQRWSTGDTLWLWVQVRNVLGSGSALQARLRAAAGAADAIELLDTLRELPLLPANSTSWIGPFRALPRYQTTEPLLLRLECRDSTGWYRDALFVRFVPVPNFTTFSNAVAQFSIADDGALGFADFPDNTLGIGFRYRDACGLLYSGGLFAGSGSRIVSAAPSLFGRDSDFAVLKPFAPPDATHNVLSDANAPEFHRIGLRLEQRFLGFIAESSAVARLLITLENASASTLPDLGAAYFMDWDLGTGGRANSARLFTEALQPEIALPHCAEVIEREGYPSVGACVVALDTPAAPQCAGLAAGVFYGDADRVQKQRLLTAGTTVQPTDSGDVALVAGMRFTGELHPGQRRRFLLCFGAAESSAALSALFHQCIADARALAVEALPAAPVLLRWQPPGILTGMLPQPGEWRLELWDILGRALLTATLTVAPDGRFQLPLPSLPAGIYAVQLSHHRSRFRTVLALPP